jgi:glycosyltransferase involved in cell wall biosynthesis
MHLAAAVIVTSHATLDAARERWPDQRYRVIPLATDPWFHPDETEVRTSQPTVLYTGGFDPRKRVADLIDAVVRLRVLVPEVRLVLCGAPPRAIVDLAERKLADRVEFSGYLEDEELAGWYRRAWVVAYPTDMEGFGFPLLEGFASGTPVVATRVGSIPEIAGDAAALVERGDVEQLADALGRLITDNQLSEKLRIAGLRRASEFTWGQVARSTLAVYREVIHG